MSTHRYPLPDGRRLEIRDPMFEGRAYISIDGELLGENTIAALQTTQRFTLRDGAELTIQVTGTAPLLRSWDVRVDGEILPGSLATDVRLLRGTVGALLAVAAVDFASSDDICGIGFGVSALAIAGVVWMRYREKKLASAPT